MTIKEAEAIVLEMGCHPYNKLGMIDALQKGYEIAIDKACKWIEDYLFEIGYPDDWVRDSKNMESGEKRFRKAMEGEL